MTEFIINKIESKHFPYIVAINDAAVEYTSPMDEARLEQLLSYTDYARVAEVNHEVVAFILAMGINRPYVNDNYNWFASRYQQFLYIDRIVVRSDWAGKKIGSRLYDDIFQFCRQHAIPVLACEINVVPPNPNSILFHQKYGFNEVGTQWLGHHTKQVSMRVANTAPKT